MLAGGHSLLPAMKLRLARPALLVDISRIARAVLRPRARGPPRDRSSDPAQGRCRRRVLHEYCPIVSFTAGLIGDPQVRHRGTIGGSLAHGDPASDLPAVVLALDASIVVRGPGGERTIPARELLHRRLQDRARARARCSWRSGCRSWPVGRLVVREDDPSRPGLGDGRGRGDLARRTARDGRPRSGSTNMGATPLRASAAEQALAGGASLEEASALIADGTEPSSDHAASSDFRRHLASVLGRRALEEAMRTVSGVWLGQTAGHHSRGLDVANALAAPAPDLLEGRAHERVLGLVPVLAGSAGGEARRVRSPGRPRS